MSILTNAKSSLEELVFRRRAVVIALFLVVTFGMIFSATGIRIDASFLKRLPLKHDYMKTFVEYRDEIGGGSRVLVAVMTDQGDIFTPEYFETLKEVTDEVFFLPGVDRGRVKSLFTPNVRYTEVIEDGIAAGKVVPADFRPTREGLEEVRQNILKAGIVGRLVAKDFSGVLISAPLLELDPMTGERINYIRVSRDLEEKIRQRFETETIHIHIIGFAKFIGNMTAGAKRVLFFFLVAFVVTAVFVYWYSQSWKITLIPLACSLVAVSWQLGLLPLLGFGLDPMSILVPFLVFAIAVSHGVQMIGAVRAEALRGAGPVEAARLSFRSLLVPGTIALASDTIGFVTILLIEVSMIQEMAIIASLGVASIIFTNLFLLPVLMSYMSFDAAYLATVDQRLKKMAGLWKVVAKAAAPKPALAIVITAAVLFGLGLLKATDIQIGDMHRGVPELRADSRYNRDTAIIVDEFSVGLDVLTVIAQAVPEGCLDYDIMTKIDDFAWYMSAIEGVQSVMSLPGRAKIINAGWNEGGLNWRVLPRNYQNLAQSVRGIRTTSGLLNRDCSVMPVKIFTVDHKAETIARIVKAVEDYQAKNHFENLEFKLASGNVGIMAATNQEVEAAQFPILLYVFCAIIVLCAVTYRSLRVVLCIVLPLALVSILAYALMTFLEIGLKVTTLPVVALGVGVGVDYGIYIFSRLKSHLDEGKALEEAYRLTLETTGNGVVFTGITLAIGVATWMFSSLKFQADMGLLLTFMFLLNMLGSILLLPALAQLLGVRGTAPSTVKPEANLLAE